MVLNRFGIQSSPIFALDEVVRPVAIVDSAVDLTVSSLLEAYGTPASAGEVVAPAINTRLADTGALAAGSWTFMVWVGSLDASQSYRLRRRNAADAADVWSFRFFPNVANGPGFAQFRFRVGVASGERLVVENAAAGGGGSTYQASIFAVAG